MKIGFGCDHAGVELKLALMDFLKEMGHECVDYGNYVRKSSSKHVNWSRPKDWCSQVLQSPQR